MVTGVNLGKKTFVVYIVYLNTKIVVIHLAWNVQIIFLNIKKASESILVKYANYLNIFLKQLAIELPEYFDINKTLVNLKLDK